MDTKFLLTETKRLLSRDTPSTLVSTPEISATPADE
jgi:hypothetical protein